MVTLMMTIDNEGVLWGYPLGLMAGEQVEPCSGES